MDLNRIFLEQPGLIKTHVLNGSKRNTEIFIKNIFYKNFSEEIA